MEDDHVLPLIDEVVTPHDVVDSVLDKGEHGTGELPAVGGQVRMTQR